MKFPQLFPKFNSLQLGDERQKEDAKGRTMEVKRGEDGFPPPGWLQPEGPLPAMQRKRRGRQAALANLCLAPPAVDGVLQPPVTRLASGARGSTLSRLLLLLSLARNVFHIYLASVRRLPPEVAAADRLTPLACVFSPDLTELPSFVLETSASPLAESQNPRFSFFFFFFLL